MSEKFWDMKNVVYSKKKHAKKKKEKKKKEKFKKNCFDLASFLSQTDPLDLRGSWHLTCQVHWMGQVRRMGRMGHRRQLSWGDIAAYKHRVVEPQRWRVGVAGAVAGAAAVAAGAGAGRHPWQAAAGVAAAGAGRHPWQAAGVAAAGAGADRHPWRAVTVTVTAAAAEGSLRQLP
jgi:hypothetical protein